MPEAGVVLLFVAFAAIALAAWWWQQELKRRRIAALTRIARGLGFQYSERDPFGLLSLPFALLDRGKGRGVENVLWGELDGAKVRSFDYWYYEEHTDAKGHRSRTYHRFSCSVAELPAACPHHLSVGRENLLTRIASGVGFHDIELESEEFNREFRVKASEQKFAYEVLDGPMMAWMLSHGGDHGFEIGGKWAMVSCGRLAPAEVPAMLALLRQFRARIPRVVWSLYAPGSGS